MIWVEEHIDYNLGQWVAKCSNCMVSVACSFCKVSTDYDYCPHCGAARKKFRAEEKGKDQSIVEFMEGEYIIYQNGDRFEIGKIKRLTADGAFVYYSSGDTAAHTPFDCIHKLINAYTIEKTSLGGEDNN